MHSPLRIDVYCEDASHEAVVRALVRRLADKERAAVDLRMQSGRGGKGKAITELKGWQAVRQKKLGGIPDVLVIVIDANCDGPNQKKKEILQAVDPSLFPSIIVGCPDPHVERWLLADPPSFARVVGMAPLPDPGKCERSAYKDLLQRSIERANQLVQTTAAQDFAPDLVGDMDLFGAGKSRPELKHFIEELENALRLAPHV